MIIKDKKIIFIHIPKTAGTSIINVFGINKVDHILAKDIKKKQWENYFTFTVIRNPFDRLVSHYIYHTKYYGKGTIFKYLKINEWKNISFEKYIEIIKNNNDKINNFRSQYEFITHPSGILINQILYFENLKNDWVKIKDKFNLKDLSHTKRTIHKDYRFYYNFKTKKFVETFYKDDLEFFKYKF